MALHLDALVVDAADPPRLAAFWAGLLRWDLVDDPAEGPRLVPTDGTRFSILFEPNDEPKRGPNQLHLDLTSTSLDDQAATVARALRLGARHLDIGQRPEEGHVVLADPEGNELCVVGPGNRFLEGCGFVGAMACDGSRATGRFWSEALGWPLVWDEGEETAIQSDDRSLFHHVTKLGRRSITRGSARSLANFVPMSFTMCGFGTKFDRVVRVRRPSPGGGYVSSCDETSGG